MVRDFFPVVPELRDLLDALWITGQQNCVGDVALARLDVILNLVVRVFTIACHLNDRASGAERKNDGHPGTWTSPGTSGCDGAIVR